MNAAFYFIFIACVVLKIGRDEQLLTSAIAIFVCLWSSFVEQAHTFQICKIPTSIGATICKASRKWLKQFDKCLKEQQHTLLLLVYCGETSSC